MCCRKVEKINRYSHFLDRTLVISVVQPLVIYCSSRPPALHCYLRGKNGTNELRLFLKISQNSENCFCDLDGVNHRQVLSRLLCQHCVKSREYPWLGVAHTEGLLFFCCEHKTTYKFSFIVKFVYYCKIRMGSITFSFLLPTAIRYIITTKLINMQHYSYLMSADNF